MAHQMTVKELLDALKHEVSALEIEKEQVTVKLLEISKEVDKRYQLIKDLSGYVTPFE